MAAINIYGKPIKKTQYTSMSVSSKVFRTRSENSIRSQLSEALDTHPVLLSQRQQATDSRDRAKEKDAAGAEIVLIHRDWGSITDRQKMYHHHEKGFTPNEEIFTG